MSGYFNFKNLKNNSSSEEIFKIIYFSGLILSADFIRKTDIEIQKNVVINTNSNREKMLPPRKSPRVPPIELSRSIIVNGSNFVT